MSADRHDSRAAEVPTGAREVNYQLLYPVEIKNTRGEVLETVSELRLHRMSGKSLRDIANAGDKKGDALARMVCASARIPMSTFDMLDAEDAAAAGEIAASFMGESRRTGGT